MTTPVVCPHCLMDSAIRNPSGFCDHLYYPENCRVCFRRERHIVSGVGKVHKSASSPGFWWAELRWAPDDDAVVKGNHAYLETLFYPVAQVAQQAAEDYAKKLGVEIEWEEVDIL